MQLKSLLFVFCSVLHHHPFFLKKLFFCKKYGRQRNFGLVLALSKSWSLRRFLSCSLILGRILIFKKYLNDSANHENLDLLHLFLKNWTNLTKKKHLKIIPYFASTRYIYIYIYIYWQHFFINTNFVEYNEHFISTHFLVDPFILPNWFYSLRRELTDIFSIIFYFPSTFCPTSGYHQGRMYYKSEEKELVFLQKLHHMGILQSYVVRHRKKERLVVRSLGKKNG